MKKISKLAARLSIALIAAFVTLELALRLFPTSLPRFLGNEVFSPYRFEPDGIYFTEAVSGQRLMKPNQSITAFFNSLFWEHKTDPWGFRNPPDTPTDVFLVGDSMIYGHGVDTHETATHFLGSEHGLPVYNVARAGDCILQNYIMVRTLLQELSPRKIVLVVFINDFKDIDLYRENEKLTFEAVKNLDYPGLLNSIKNYKPPKWTQVSYAIRFCNLLPIYLDRKLPNQPPAQAGERERLRMKAPELRETVAEGAELSEASKETFQATLKDLKKHCQAAGIELEVVFLHIGTFDSGFLQYQTPIDQFLRQLTSELEIPYHCTEELFQDQPDSFIPIDGHLSPKGHRRFAEWLAEKVLTR